MEKSHQWPQILAVFSATWLAIGCGIQLSWPSPSVPKLLSGDLGFNLSEDEASYVVMISPLGYLIGSPLSGFFLDKIGRQYTLLMLAPIQAVAWITIASADNAITIYCARVLMGISEGGMFTAFPAYIGEVVEPHIRGRAGASISWGLLLGSLLINIYGSFVSIRTAAYISLLIPFIFTITFAWMPESPYYLIARGRDHDARKALKALRRMSDVETELFQIKKDVLRQQSEPGRFQDIFAVNSNLKGFVILALLRTIQQFSGMYVIGFYLQIIFKSGESSVSPEASSIISSVFRAFFVILGSVLIDRFGRRLMLSASCITTSLILFIIGTYFYLLGLGYNLDGFKWLPLVAIVMYYVCCSMGLLMIPTLMMGELLSNNIKAKALSLMNIYFGFCMSASSKVFQWTESRFGAHVPFFVFMIVCIFGVITTHTIVPETKGKTLEEIQQTLKGNASTKESIVLLQQSI